MENLYIRMTDKERGRTTIREGDVEERECSKEKEEGTIAEFFRHIYITLRYFSNFLFSKASMPICLYMICL